MSSAGNARHVLADSSVEIDVLAFPPDQAELQRRQLCDAKRWRALEQRARIALFFAAGMFLAWAADVGAALEIGPASGTTLFGMASVPIAITIALAYLYGRWTIDRANRGRAQLQQRYADTTLREATPLIELARTDAVVAQYLRCVGRQGRALATLERTALQTWADSSRRITAK